MTPAVYLDLDGTLVEFSKPYGEIVTGALETAGVPDPEPVAETYGDRFFAHFEALADDPYRRALEDAFEDRGVDADPKRAADALVEAELDAAIPRAGAQEFVDLLSAGNELGVLTNGVPAVQRGKLDQIGLADAFDATVISYEVGAHKPDQAIFEAARDRLDADAYVYVGDNLEHDIEPARDAGFLAVHLDDAAASMRVSGFDDLLALGRVVSDRPSRS